ncbi:MAG: GGDEF domain-containing protein [Gordonibacter sp.]
MFPYADIHPKVASTALELLQFDSYRLVDPRDHRVFAYGRDVEELRQEDEPCYRIWKRSEPCLNCTSRSCLAQQAPLFKIEYLDGRVLLVYSLPSEVEGKIFALELVMDVTKSLLVSDIAIHDNIEITHMITKFNELAVCDGFTKLFNKTYINNTLEGYVQAVKRDPAADCATVALLDIDGFKFINDTYGHVSGDDALLYFANKLRNLARELDAWAGRFGGDEFVLCSSRMLDEKDIERLFEEIDSIERHVFEAETGSYSLAASCGVCFVRLDDTVHSLLNRVDDAMYQAKLLDRRLVVR